MTGRMIAMAVAVALAVGCGDAQPKTAVVRGTVTLNGKPVPRGTVTFLPDGGGPPATGEIQPDGKYALTTFRSGDGAVVGKYKVMIVAMQDNADKLPEERTPLPPPIIPIKYTSLATSPLTADVQDKENTIDFPLK